MAYTKLFLDGDIQGASGMAFAAIQEDSVAQYKEAALAHPDHFTNIDFKLAIAQYAHAQKRSELFIHILRDEDTYPGGRDVGWFNEALERQDLTVLTHLIERPPELDTPFKRQTTNDAISKNNPDVLACLITAFDDQLLADNILIYLLGLRESTPLINAVIDAYSWKLDNDDVLRQLVRQLGDLAIPYETLGRMIEPGILIEKYTREERFKSNLLSGYLRM